MIMAVHRCWSLTSTYYRLGSILDKKVFCKRVHGVLVHGTHIFYGRQEISDLSSPACNTLFSRYDFSIPYYSKRTQEIYVRSRSLPGQFGDPVITSNNRTTGTGSGKTTAAPSRESTQPEECPPWTDSSFSLYSRFIIRLAGGKAFSFALTSNHMRVAFSHPSWLGVGPRVLCIY